MNSPVGQLYSDIFKSVLSSFLSNPKLLVLAFVVFVVFPVVSFLIKQYQYNHSGLKEIDQMSGEDFEQYLVSLFTKLGFQVQHIGKLGDFGGDMIIVKDGVKTLVQAKRQKYKVKESSVQQAIAAKEYYHCDKAMVVTNNYYWTHAWKLGKETGTILWTRKELQNAILSTKSNN